MVDYHSSPVVYFSQPALVDIIQEVKLYQKGWCTFQGTYWSCELNEVSSLSIRVGEKAIVIGRKGNTLIVQAFM